MTGQIVLFNLDDHAYAVALSAVDRTVRMVEVTPLPHAPAIVTGVINVQGRIIPVLNIRNRFRLPERAATLSDQLLIARTERRTVALIVDSVNGVIDLSEREITRDEDILLGLSYVTGVVKFTDGMIFIHNLDEFLSLEEEDALTTALAWNDTTDDQQ